MQLLTRRSMLQLFGLAATSMLPWRVARAQSAPPKRIVFFYTPQGTLRQMNPDGTFVQYWAPTAPGAPDALSLTTPWSTNQHTLGDMHQALVPYTSDLLFLDGIDMASVWVDPTPADGAHAAGRTHSLAAVNRLNADEAGGVSIDQYIAKGLNTPAPVTRLPSLQMFCSANSNNLDSAPDTPLYAGSGQPLAAVVSPADIYAHMFPNGPQNSADVAAAASALAQHRSVLDHALADFTHLSAKVTGASKQRVDSHAQALRDLELRLALPAVTCVQPDASAGPAVADQGNAASLNANTDAMMRLLQVGFACDLTRVATIIIDDAPDDAFGFTPIAGAPTFHDLVHATNGVLGDGANPLMTTPSAIATVKAFHSYHASLFAKLIGLLDSVTEADGSTLLDNTLVVWTGELAGGDHSVDHLPYVTAGKLGGAVTPGRYVRFPRSTKQLDNCSQSQICSKGLGPAHNDLLASLATMVGVPTTTFGNTAVSSGGPLNGWQT